MTKRIRALVFALFAAASIIAAPAFAQDAAEFVVRLGRIEAENRRLNGRVEELEQIVRKLEEQLKRFQEDVEFRLSAGEKPAAPAGASPRVAQPAAPPPARRGDAFDPTAAPSAPGAPRPLGTTPPSAPLASAARPVIQPAPQQPGAPLALPSAAPAQPLPTAAPKPVPQIAAPTADAQADFNVAFGYIQRNENEAAELAFKQFLEAHPKSALRGSATYWLGESYFRRGLHREAAEQYLKVSTDYAKSGAAPQGMLRLGQSLAALGAKDQACATLREIDKRYPNTSTAFKKDIEREAKKANCEAA